MGRNSGTRVRAHHVRGDQTGTAGAENDAFLKLWARGAKATAPIGRQGTVNGKANGGIDINAFAKYGCYEEVIDLGGASSAFSTGDMLPANALILPIVTHAVEDFTTPTTYDLGDETTNARFGDNLTNDVVGDGPAYATVHWDASPDNWNTTAQRIKVTPNAAGQGKVHVAVFYIQFAGGQK